MIDQQEMQAVLSKIRKLLALSTSSNPHEAAAAAAKAQELLAQYNLEVSHIPTSDPVAGYGQTAVQTGARVWRRQLLRVLAQYNFCETVYDGGHKRAMLIGQRHNSEAVHYLYEHLIAQLEPMATAAYGRSWSELPAVTWKDSFFAGAIESIRVRLRAQQSTFAATSSECRALVVVKSEELQQAVKQFYPQLRPGRTKAVRSCDGYYDGVHAGRNVTLNKAIAQ